MTAETTTEPAAPFAAEPANAEVEAEAATEPAVTAAAEPGDGDGEAGVSEGVVVH